MFNWLIVEESKAASLLIAPEKPYDLNSLKGQFSSSCLKGHSKSNPFISEAMIISFYVLFKYTINFRILFL